MSGTDRESLQVRVDHLETAVEEIHRSLRQLHGTGINKSLKIRGTVRPPSGPMETPRAVLPVTPKPRPASSGVMRESEFWLKIIGVGLLLFGVGFLFKFSIEHGWLSEPVRVGIGLVIGLVLFATGIRLHADRRHFSQVLLGGGIATYYITGFAAFQLYALVPHTIAFSFMVAVTLLAFFPVTETG